MEKLEQDWREEYKKQYMDYMKDGALFLSVRNFFSRVVIKARINEHEMACVVCSEKHRYKRHIPCTRIAELKKELK